MKNLKTKNADYMKPKQKFSKAHRKYLFKYHAYNVTVILTQIAILVAFLVAWEIFANLGKINTFFFSYPSQIGKTLNELYQSGELWYHTKITLKETLLGFSIATSAGFIIAVILWALGFLQKVTEPYLVVINALPKIALGPMIILWFGAGQTAIIFMCILIVVFVTTMNILHSFNSCDTQLIAQAKSLGANKLQIFFKLILPNSLKDIVSTMKINVGLSWIGAIMGEYLIIKGGLGYLIQDNMTTFNLRVVMATIIVLCVLAASMYFIVALFEKLIKKIYQ